MNRAGRSPLRVLESPNLILVAATPELVDADLGGRESLAVALEAEVPESWPPELFSAPVRSLSRQLLEDPAERGWSAWYLLARGGTDAVLVGLCQFRGRPDARGSVEIAYSILRGYRNLGYATEAVGRLVRWAFGHPNVNEVTAETMPYRRQSIRIMEKNGFLPAGPGSEPGVVRYVLRKSAHR